MENNNNYNNDNLEDRLSSVIDDILDSGNLENLSKRVSDTVESAVCGFADGINRIYSRAVKKQRVIKIDTSPVSKVKSVISVVLGGVITVLGLLTSLPFLFLDGKTPLLIALLAAGSGVFLISHGVKIWGLSNRLALYRRRLELLPPSENGLEIADFAENMNMPVNRVNKDIKFFVSKNVFMGGNLSNDGTRFFATKDEYKDYLSHEQAKRVMEQQRESESEYEKQTRVFFENMESFIRDIRISNNLIPDEEMSKKLDTTEAVVSKIFERLKENPKLLPQARKLGEYYLPLTKKLVDAYAKLSENSIETDSMKKSKNEIEKTLDTVNKAFYNLYAGLFDDDVIDINSDISVLNTMLAREGLVEDISQKERKWTE